MPGQPVAHRRVLVRGVVVHDQVHREVGRELRIQVPQERAKNPS